MFKESIYRTFPGCLNWLPPRSGHRGTRSQSLKENSRYLSVRRLSTASYSVTITKILEIKQSTMQTAPAFQELTFKMKFTIEE